MASAHAAAAAATTQVRELGKPRSYDGSRARWRHWSATMVGYMCMMDTSMPDAMNRAEQDEDPIDHVDFSPGDMAKDFRFYYALLACVEGDALEE